MSERLVFCSYRDLDEVRRLVEDIMQTALSPRESSYFGGDYFRGKTDADGEVIVQRNRDLDERVIDHDAPTLVAISSTSRADDLVDAFAGEPLELVSRTSK